MVLLLASCTSMYKQAPNQTKFLVVYVYGVVLFLASCTSMYKQAFKQTYLNFFMFTGWCFFLHLVLWCTNRHQNKPILVVYVYGVVLLLVSCTSMYKQAPDQNFLGVYVYDVVLFLASCTSMYKTALNKPIFNCLCLPGGAFTRILSFGVQTDTKTSLF